MTDFKLAEFARRLPGFDRNVCDLPRHRFPNLVDKSVDFGKRAFHDQLDLPVREVFNPTLHLVSSSNFQGRIPKTDSLNVPGKQNLFSLHDRIKRSGVTVS